jgi:hypothetical protein
MSAFVCSKNHIAAVAHYAVTKGVWLGEGSAKPEDFGRVYKALAKANVRSVCHRYEDDDAGNYADVLRAPRRGASSHTPVEIIKLCECLDYQSSEVDDWRESEACRLLDNIRATAVCALPGYADAQWAIA